jgi:hypothetical protein
MCNSVISDCCYNLWVVNKTNYQSDRSLQAPKTRYNINVDQEEIEYKILSWICSVQEKSFLFNKMLGSCGQPELFLASQEALSPFKSTRL